MLAGRRAAAALWLTLRLLPLTADGLGAVLRPGRQAALDWAARIDASDELRLYQPPQLDILTYFPARDRLSDVDAASAAAMAAGMARPRRSRSTWRPTPSTAAALAARGHHLDIDVPRGRILRSVLMKPEHEAAVPELHRQLLALLGT